MCNPQVDEVRLMRTLRQVRAHREPTERFWMAWSISEDLVLLNERPDLPTLTRAGELELKDLEAEYPQIPDLY